MKKYVEDILLDSDGRILFDNKYGPLIVGRYEMAKLVWDTIGEHFYETGIDHVVLYPVANNGTYPEGVAWNGVTSISESPSGADANKQWADNMNYLTLYSAEEYGSTIEAFTYPDEFMACDGTVALTSGVYVGQQPRKGFGLSYRTKVGNDTVGEDLGYKLHLVYGCRAAPSERGYETVNDSPEAITFSWEITTTPVIIPNHKPSALLTIDSRDFTETAAAAHLKALEDVLYGGDSTEARLPLPNEVVYILTGQTITGETGYTG